MSFSSWPSTETVAAALKAEAKGDAVRLGHRLVDWVNRGGNFYSRCITCLEPAVVRPRSQTVARLGGVALNMRCEGRRL